MGIRPDSVRQLMSGRLRLTPGHFQTLLSGIVAQRKEPELAEAELRAWLTQHPEES
jgi:hypothetical protein